MNGLTIKLFLAAFMIFIITDTIWLSFIARNLYIQGYEPLLRLEAGKLQLIWWAALIVYLLLALSIIVFVLPLADNSLMWAAIYGAILGAVIYGIYDFTCLAIFKNFPVGVSLIDWAWGTILCSWTSFLTLYLSRYFK